MKAEPPSLRELAELLTDALFSLLGTTHTFTLQLVNQLGELAGAAALVEQIKAAIRSRAEWRQLEKLTSLLKIR